MKQRDLLPRVLLFLFILIWVILAFGVANRRDWFLENILTALFVPTLVLTYRKYRFSNVSYSIIFFFLVLHTYASHYTYSNVPLGFALQNSFGFARNHFDRVVHFLFGLMMFYPIQELVYMQVTQKPFWSTYLSFAMVLSFSALYEMVEWLVAIIVEPSLGIAFLGTQGDAWDAYKDMASAVLGALLAVVLFRKKRK